MQGLRWGFCALLCLGFAAGGVAAREKTGPTSIEWDRVANIKNAAVRIGRIQRAKGAEVAMTLISNCYKTHTLFERYSQGFESCLVQDHLETRVLVEIYSRMQPEALRRIGAPSKESLIRANVARYSVTLAKYKFPQPFGNELRKLADKHGWPVFIKTVFPNVQQGDAKKSKPTPRPLRKKR